MVEMDISFMTENGCFIHVPTTPNNSSQKLFFLLAFFLGGGHEFLNSHLKQEKVFSKSKILDVLSEKKNELSDCCAQWFNRGVSLKEMIKSQHSMELSLVSFNQTICE